MSTNIGRAVLEISTDQSGFMRDVAALKNEAQTNLPSAFKKARTAVDDLAAGLSKAGDDARGASNSIAGMSASGRDELGKLARGATPAIGAFDKLKSAVGSINPILGAFGASLSIGAVVGFAKEIGDFAGNMVDLSAETQISTSRLQAFNYVGAGVGLSIDKITASGEMLAKRLGGDDDSVTGALKKLNLSAGDLKQLSLDEVIFRIDDQLKNVGNQFERASTLTDLFGRSGVQMGRLLDGSLRDVITATEKTSAIIDEELLKKADEFSDKWDQAWVHFRAFALEAIDAVAKGLGGLADLATFGIRPGAYGAAPPGQQRSPRRIGAAPSSGLLQLDTSHLGGPGLRIEDGRLVFGALDRSDTVAGEGIKGVKAESEHSKAMRSWTDEVNKGVAATEAWVRSMHNLRGEALMKQDAAVLNAFLNSPTSDATKKLRDLMLSTVSWKDSLGRTQSMGTTPGILPNFNAGLTAGLIFGPSDISGRPQGGGAQPFSAFGSIGGDLKNFWGNLSGGHGVGGMLSNLGGDLVTGGLNSLLNAGMGLVTKGLGKLFGGLFGGEGKETNNLRDSKLMDFTGADSLRAAQDTFRKMAAEAGVTDAEMRRVFDTKKIKDFETAADSAFSKIRQFQSEQAADAERLTAAIERYGFTLEQLGPSLQKQRLDDQAKELIEDWRVLVGAGINVEVVNSQMAEAIDEYLQTAIRVGAEVPSAMRPVLENMLKQGTLTDAAGNAITDLEAAGIHFSETMTEGFDRVVVKLDELIAKLGLAGDALGALPINIADTSGLSQSDLIPVPAMGTGGIAVRPLLSLIGERGPEAVIPLNRLGAITGADGRGGDSNIVVAAIEKLNRSMDRRFSLLPSQMLAAALARV